MKFFLLAHNLMSLVCLNKLIKTKQFPDFVVIHKNLDAEKLKESFYSPIEQICNRYNIKLYKVVKLDEIKEAIKGSDFGICAGFMQIISEEILGLPEKGIYNLHCGKLPKYRGRAPISRTIINGENNVIITIHKIDSGVDSGEICFERNIKITGKDDVNSLYKKCSIKSAILISDFINRIEKGKITLRKQKITEKANLKITDSERKINWNNSPKKNFNLIRALSSPYPNSYCYYNLNKIYFNKAKVVKNRYHYRIRNGEIIRAKNESLVIKCRGGFIQASGFKDDENTIINVNKTFLLKSIFI